MNIDANFAEIFFNGSYTLDHTSTQFFPDSEGRWQVFGLFLLVLAGITGNLLVCLAVCVEKKLQNVTNYFLVSLSVADLFVSLIVMPGAIVQEFIGHWPLGLAMCTIWQICDVTMCTSSIMHMCTISLDRYLGVRDPIKTRNRSRLVVAIKISAVWLFSLTIASPLVILGTHRPYEILHPQSLQCAIYNSYFLVYGSIAAFFGPLVVMLVTYSLTIRLLSKRARQLELRSHEGMRRSMTRRKSSNDPMMGGSRSMSRFRGGGLISVWGPLSSGGATTESSTDEIHDRFRPPHSSRTSESSGFLEPRARYPSDASERYPRIRRGHRSSCGTEGSVSVSIEQERSSRDTVEDSVIIPIIRSERRVSTRAEQKESLESTGTEISEKDDSIDGANSEKGEKYRSKVIPKIGELENKYFSRQKIDESELSDQRSVDSAVVLSRNKLTEDDFKKFKSLSEQQKNSHDEIIEEVEQEIKTQNRSRASVDLGTKRHSSYLSKRKVKRSVSTQSEICPQRVRERDVRLTSSLKKFDLKKELRKLHQSVSAGTSEGIEPVSNVSTEVDINMASIKAVELMKLVQPSASETSDTGVETQTKTSSTTQIDNKINISQASSRTALARIPSSTRRRLSRNFIKHELNRRFSVRQRLKRQNSTDVNGRGETRNGRPSCNISLKPLLSRGLLSPGGYDDLSDPQSRVSCGSCSGDDPSCGSVARYNRSYLMGSSSNCSDSETQSRIQTPKNPPSTKSRFSPLNLVRAWYSDDSEDVSGTSSATPRDQVPRVVWSRRSNSSVKLELRSLVKRHGASIRLAAGIFLTANSSIDEGSGESPATRFRRGANSSLYAVKTERKAVKVLGTMFFIFVVSWASFFCLNLAMGVCSACEIDARIFKCFLWLGYASSMLNPIVYTIFNNSFKRTFVQLLTCKFCKKRKAPRNLGSSSAARRGWADRGEESGRGTGCRYRSGTLSGEDEPFSRHRLSKVSVNFEGSEAVSIAQNEA